jgi:hypothetical protein
MKYLVLPYLHSIFKFDIIQITFHDNVQVQVKIVIEDYIQVIVDNI